MSTINENKTLNELENTTWGGPPAESYLVRTCHMLREKPLKDFTVEDLRIMIGQNFSLPLLIPKAIEILKRDILAEGHYYEGDLLKAVLTSSTDFWKENSTYYFEVMELYLNNIDRIGTDKIFTNSFERFDNIFD